MSQEKWRPVFLNLQQFSHKVIPFSYQRLCSLLPCRHQRALKNFWVHWLFVYFCSWLLFDFCDIAISTWETWGQREKAADCQQFDECPPNFQRTKSGCFRQYKFASTQICYPDPVPLAPLALEISFLTKIGGYPLDCSGRFSDMLCYLLLCCLGIGLHEFKQRLFFQSDIQRAILALWRISSVTLAHWNMHITITELVLCLEQ